ncbi:MAG: lipopolysaccharide transport periplasmic protein LptA [Candidatus Polarisedimenticolaceae bacterium]|nr:lipopolysaccharide transport periplasmic protein LptA [Candidatus Polarisedimenticolaceae bacterium]
MVLLLALLPFTAWGLTSDQDMPIYVEADSVDIDDQSGVSVYLGNVQVTQGTMHLLADKVTVYRVEKKTERIVAVGKPVRYRQQMDNSTDEVKGRALMMEYFVTDERLYLIDDAELIQGLDNFSSDRITYFRNRSLVKAGASAKGKERVRSVINPKDE